MVCDKEGRIGLWKRAAEELYGWKNAQARGQPADSLLHTKFPKPLAEVEAVLYGTGRWEGELMHEARDGRVLVMSSRWSLKADEDGAWVGILRVESDITDRKGLERELAERSEERRV